MSGLAPALPFVDRHAVVVASPWARTWPALRAVASDLGFDPDGAFARILALMPPSGFAMVEAAEPHTIVLAGRHRFSVYRLVFTAQPGAEGETRVAATTYAAFPGVLGRAYRLLVISSGAHRIAVGRMLRSVARRVAEAR